jgi:hypothetical protein
VAIAWPSGSAGRPGGRRGVGAAGARGRLFAIPCSPRARRRGWRTSACSDRRLARRRIGRAARLGGLVGERRGALGDRQRDRDGDAQADDQADDEAGERAAALAREGMDYAKAVM